MNKSLSHVFAKKEHCHHLGNAAKRDSVDTVGAQCPHPEPEEAPSARDHIKRGQCHALGGKKSRNYEKALITLNTFFEKEQVHGRPNLIGSEATAQESHERTKAKANGKSHHRHQSKGSSLTGSWSNMGEAGLQSPIGAKKVKSHNRHNCNGGDKIITSLPSSRATRRLKTKPKLAQNDNSTKMNLNGPANPSDEDSLLLFENPSFEADSRGHPKPRHRGGEEKLVMRRKVAVDALPDEPCPANHQKPNAPPAHRRVASHDNHGRPHHGRTTCQEQVQSTHLSQMEAPHIMASPTNNKKATLTRGPSIATSIANNIRNHPDLLVKLLVETYEDKEFQRELAPSLHGSVVSGLVDSAGLQDMQTAATMATRDRRGHLRDPRFKGKQRTRNNRGGTAGGTTGRRASLSLQKLYN